VLKIVQDKLAVIGKGAAARKERERVAAAVASDEPSTESLVETHLSLRAHTTEI